MSRLLFLGLAAVLATGAGSVHAEESPTKVLDEFWPGLNLEAHGLLHVWAVPFDQNDPTINDPIVVGDPDLDEGFAVRRARLGVKGALSESTHFELQLGYNGAFTGSEERHSYPELEDAFLEFNREKYPGIRLGVGKVPFGAQQWVSSKSLLLIERAATSEVLTFGRDIGLTIFGQKSGGEGSGFGFKDFRWYLGLYNGSGSLFMDDNGLGDVSYTGSTPAGAKTNPFGLLQVIRLQADFGTVAAPEGEANLGRRSWSDFSLRLGTNAAGNRELESNTVAYGADVGLYVGPLSTQFEAIWSTTAAQYTGEGEVDVYGDAPAFGWYLQGGLLVVPDRLQLAVRYEYFDGNRHFEDGDDIATVGLGLNYYPFAHEAFKLQLNYVRRIERTETIGINNDTLYMNLGMYF